MHSFTERTTEIEFTAPLPAVPNGAWTWFTGERAIVDAGIDGDGVRILVGIVTAEGDADGGDIDVLRYDTGSGHVDHAGLHEGFEQDDHDGPALYRRPDGRYLAMYAKHGRDTKVRWRVSTRPHDPSQWEPERTLDTGAETTYCNVHDAPGAPETDATTYCFARTRNWDPNVLVSTDDGSTWSHGGRLLERGDGSVRPYVRYGTDGDRIHLTTTEHHPHDHDNGVYHGFVEGESLWDSRGRVLVDDLFDDDGGSVGPSELTTVFDSGTEIDGDRLTHAWTVDTSVDGAGHPVAVFQARVDADPADHRFVYARFDGREWTTHQIAKAGPRLYESELDYTGLATIDPCDANGVVVSTPIDPRDDASLGHRELFAGATSDRGATWKWKPLTPDASTDNIRPLVPAWEGDRTALVWMRGPYYTYRRWDTQVAGAVYRR